MRRAARAVAAAALLAACEQAPPTRPAAPAPAAVPLAIASFYTLAEFTREVAGAAAEVHALVPVGVEPHDWEPSPQDVARVQRARVFIHNGAGFEPWADRLLASVSGSGPLVVDTTAGITLIDAGAAGRDGHGHAEEARGAARAGRRARVDPHVWLDPVLAQAQVEAIRSGLAAADPAHAAGYAARAAAFAERLAALHAAFERGLAACARREIVVSHGAFTYPARRYRLVQVPVMGLAPDAEPSPAELARIVRFARRHQVTHVFAETLVAPKLAETLAREVGARTLVLNPIEGVTPEEAAAGRGYVALMEQNLANLRTGLDCR